jgi:hypothetical protein
MVDLLYTIGEKTAELSSANGLWKEEAATIMSELRAVSALRSYGKSDNKRSDTKASGKASPKATPPPLYHSPSTFAAEIQSELQAIRDHITGGGGGGGGGGGPAAKDVAKEAAEHREVKQKLELAEIELEDMRKRHGELQQEMEAKISSAATSTAIVKAFKPAKHSAWDRVLDLVQQPPAKDVEFSSDLTSDELKDDVQQLVSQVRVLRSELRREKEQLAEAKQQALSHAVEHQAGSPSIAHGSRLLSSAAPAAPHRTTRMRSNRGSAAVRIDGSSF